MKTQLEKLHNTTDLREQIQKAVSTAQSIKSCVSKCTSSRLSLLPEQPLLADCGQHQEGHTALKDHLHLQVLEQRTVHLYTENTGYTASKVLLLEILCTGLFSPRAIFTL